MIQFFNKAVCIILVIVIAILFIKTIYTEHFDFKTVNPAPIYHGEYKDDFNNLLNRLVNDSQFVDSINKLYKKEYNESELRELIINNKHLLLNTKIARDELRNIPKKYELILDTYKNLNDKYLNQKKKLEHIFVNDFKKEEDLSDFNLKNLKLKNKLKDFALSVTKYQEEKNEFNDGKIMRNIITNNEITLVTNKSVNTDDFHTISGLDKNKGEHIIYYIAVNDLCLQSNFKGSFSSERCVPNEMKQFFLLFKISNTNLYNKYIRLSGNYEKEHLIDVLDNTINYPFFIICPFNIPGYAVVNQDKKLFIRPIRNDPFQRFEAVKSSTFCEINQNN
jgi:hypothetical protein